MDSRYERVQDLSREKLARFIIGLKNKARKAAPRGIPRLSRAEGLNVLPTSFAQQRLWLADQIAGDSSMYGMPGALRLNGRLGIAALGQTLCEIARRHEVLRTRFPVVDGKPAQEIRDVYGLEMPLIDLATLEQQEGEDRVRELVRDEAKRGFDLESGPVIRV